MLEFGSSLIRRCFIASIPVMVVMLTGCPGAMNDPMPGDDNPGDQPGGQTPPPVDIVLVVPSVPREGGSVVRSSVGNLVTLEAFPADGWLFDGWFGTIESTENPITLVATDDTSVSARFVEAPKPDADRDGVPDNEDACPGFNDLDDADDDGIPDECDDCPNDAANDADGDGVCGDVDQCEGHDDADDVDGDGTPDGCDDCSSDVNKSTPGICGCGTSDVDSDSDGTVDCLDSCPADIDKTLPGKCGCGVADTDTDNDNIPDCNDECDNDPDKVFPGVCGCGVEEDLSDTDNDGTLNCVDGCPDDVDKTESGICGCGVADTDTDEDGTADCIDNCPVDGNKTEPGLCDCGTADTDSDTDGTPDCNDNCPNDPLKTEPGICGCGLLENECDGCTNDLDCDDGVVCTEDTCNTQTANCVFVPNDTSCDDGDLCTIDTCDPDFGCNNEAVTCAVLFLCNPTTGVCEPEEACKTNEDCDDGLFCNGAETCDVLTRCQLGTPPTCDDTIPCTDDTCDPITDACAHTPNNANCDDGVFCNGAEVCEALTGCQLGTPPTCDDTVLCTDDTCDPVTDDCSHTLNDSNCDDGVFCNGAETCDVLLDCQAGFLMCDDGNDCTEDACVESGNICVNEIIDSDGDGIGDCDDLCPDTFVGSTVDVNGCPIGPSSWESFRTLASLQFSPNIYNFTMDGILETALINQNLAGIAIQFNGTVDTVINEIPINVETTVFTVINRFGDENATANRKIQINAFSFEIIDMDVKWTFDYIVKDIEDIGGIETYSTQLTGVMDGTISPDQNQMIFTVVSGEQVDCLPVPECDPFPLDPNQFGTVIWNRIP